MGTFGYTFDKDTHTSPGFNVSVKSSLSLIATNLITIGIALWQKWQLSDVMWVYWLQSIIIGYFQQRKIRDLEKFSTDRFQINGHSVEPTEKTKTWVANFFVLHYGLFHFVYMIFLFTFGKPDILWTLLLGFTFFANHYFSYLENKESDKKRFQNIGSMMFFPYLRIIPMHLTIIFGQPLVKSVSLVGFLLLKTLVDTIMHNIEHNKSSTTIE